MVTVILDGRVEPFCCWLRPAPPDLDINMLCTYSSILEAVKLQQWFPLNCHYSGFRPIHVDDFETHVIKNHPGKPVYPGPTPENIARALYIVESIEKELKDRKIKNRSQKTSVETIVANEPSDSLFQNSTIDGSEIDHAGSEQQGEE